MGRYVEDDGGVAQVVNKLIHDRFHGLSSVTIKHVFDTKKRMKKGNMVLASVELTNEKVKFFTSDDEAPEGYDYIMIVDYTAWQVAKDDDKERLISHEMRHMFLDEKGNCKIIDHDVQDFMAEIKLNEDKPEWARNLAQLTETMYDQNADAGN